MIRTLIRTDGDKFELVEGLDESLYDGFVGFSQIEYNPRRNLDENEVYFISDFSKKEYFLDILKSKLSTANYNLFKRNDNKDVLVNVDEDKEITYLQRITKSMLKPKKYIKFMESDTKYEKVDQDSSITINEFPDAQYNIKEDKLYFKKLESIKSIFNGIDILYRAATDEEVTDFLNSDIIKTSDGFNAASVNIYNRKRITLLKDMYNNFDKNKKKELKKYIKEYDSELPFENNKFEIGNDQDLKKLMYGIDQRYYTTRINAEKRIANSVISLK